MNKPISLVIKDVNEEIMNVINKSGLPPVVLQYIVSDIFKMVQEAAINEQRQELQQYTSELAKEEEEKPSEEE